MATPSDAISNPYEMAAGLYGQAGDMYSQAGGMDFLGTGRQVGREMAGMVPGSITQQGVQVGGYGPADLNAALYGNMNEYLNPYYEQVYKSSLGQMAEARDASLSQVGADAARSGAFGGSRHGLVEGQIYGDFNRDAGSLAAQLNSQGFNQAVATGQGMLDRDMNRGQYLTGLQTQADMSKAQNDAQLQLALSQLGVNAYGSGLSTGAGIMGSQAGNIMNAAGGLGDLATGYYAAGNDIQDRQYSYGSDQQQLNQKVLDDANATFMQYMQDPYKAMDMMRAMMAGDPRFNNLSSTGSNTTSYTPSMFDFLSAGAQAFAATR